MIGPFDFVRKFGSTDACFFCVSSLSAVTDGIDRATSVIDVGLSAGEAIGDILKQLKEKAVAAQANDLSQDQRDALQADFVALRGQIDQIANAATFNGSNLVNGTNLTAGSAAFSVLTSDIGGTSGAYDLDNVTFGTLSLSSWIATGNSGIASGAASGAGKLASPVGMALRTYSMLSAVSERTSSRPVNRAP